MIESTKLFFLRKLLFFKNKNYIINKFLVSKNFKPKKKIINGYLYQV